MKLKMTVLLVILLAVTGTAVGVIYSKHQARKQFVELQALNKQIDELNIEWGRLQLEQSAWSAHGRIEKIATNKLKMKLPAANEITYIKNEEK